MNMIFLSIAALMILAAFGLVLPPILWTRKVQMDDMDHRNILIARQRLAELKSNRQSGGLSREQYEEQKAELEQVLSDDLAIKSRISQSERQGRWMVFVIIAVVPLLSGSLYWLLGNFQAVSDSEEMAAAVPSVTPSAEDITQMVAGLAERMKANPDDAEGWLMLGKSYKYLEQYPKAVEAFSNAYRLLGDQPEVMLSYAEAIAYASNKNLSGKPTDLIFKALAKEPDNMNGLWLGGLAKVQQGDKEGALKLWSRLEALLPSDSESRREMRNIIAGLTGKAPETPVRQQTTADGKASSHSITVEVSLAPELQKSISSGDTVFIYAQALSGPRMPLAIVRKQVSDLPATVVLDDSLAMMPEMKLSNFTEVKLLARISKSGDAVSRPGDLIGTVDNAATAGSSSAQKIIINQRVE
ncbi:MAG: c-type cytochrome biogenesis protein CcmI [Gammaproteobacteria bacterium]